MARGAALLVLLLVLQDGAVPAHADHRFSTKESRCRDQPCSPPIGNLAAGRKIVTLTQCWTNRVQSRQTCSFLSDTTTNRTTGRCLAHCERCKARIHGPWAMTDSPFHRPWTWWQSKTGAKHEVLSLDLGKPFVFTHMVAIFRSSRPAVMVLERSADGGRSWHVYKFFAPNCLQEFGLADDVEETGAPCTSRYSDPEPCTQGEVIYRAMMPNNHFENPYSDTAQKLLVVTNLRLRVLRPQPLLHCLQKKGCQDPLPFSHISLYDLMFFGTCFCNGHAQRCIPAPGEGHHITVHGRCECKHYTTGYHCQMCKSLYNDRPWQPANGKTEEVNACQACHCHNHASLCHFDPALWRASQNRSGGVCDGCRDNTQGRHCHRCRPGFHRDPSQPLSSIHVCKPCSCHPLGSLSSGDQGSTCDPITGNCFCQPGVGGRDCHQCLTGYWGFGPSGCRPCHCPSSCDSNTGFCTSGTQTHGNTTWLDVPIGGAVPGLSHHQPLISLQAEEWDEVQGFSAALYPGKCVCKELKLGSREEFCSKKYTYVIRVQVLSAHDLGSHVEVIIRVKKILKRTHLKLARGKAILFPESWTHRGCTCPVLNPGTQYLVAGHEDVHRRRLLVDLQSYVRPWRRRRAKLITSFLAGGCK
uniref:netrin-4 n=1 Tax=Myxine glutinosa TaxID=7769 RepID=UPI00358E5C04